MDVTVRGQEETSRPKTTRERKNGRNHSDIAGTPGAEKSEFPDRRGESHLHSFELIGCIEEAIEDLSHQFPRIRVLRSFEDNFHDPLIGDAISLFGLAQSMLRRAAQDLENRSLYVSLKWDHLFSSETHVAFSLIVEAPTQAKEIVEADNHVSRQLIQKLGGELRSDLTHSGSLKLSARLRFPKGLMPLYDFETALDSVKVLVVDDDSMSRMLTATMLRSLKAQVVTARHGAEAIEFAKKQSFDMIFLDIEMPVMDGVSTCQILRQIPGFEHVPVLALTSHEQEQQHAYYLEHGMHEVMVKPVGKATIIEAAQRYLRRAPSVKSVRRDLMKHGDELLVAIIEGDEAAPDAHWVDEPQLRDAFADSREVLELCITVFGKRYPVLLDEIDQALLADDLREVGRAAHEIKGMLANLWTPQLSALAADIEDWAREGRAEGSRERLDKLRLWIPEALEELSEILKLWSQDI